MILKRRVQFNNIHLDALDPSIVIRRVETGTPRETVKTVSKMGGFGQRITSRHWETLECAVSFAIDKPKRDLSGRRAVFDAVNTWAAGTGWLKCTERPDRQMYVESVTFPNPGDLWDWTDEYTITFHAYSVPFWQDITSTSASGNINAGTGSLTLRASGNVQTVLNGTFQNLSNGTMDTFSITVNGNTISLSDIALESYDSLYISHDDSGLLKITKGPVIVSLYDKRSADSADDLYLNPGNNTVSITTPARIAVVCSAYGRYL